MNTIGKVFVFLVLVYATFMWVGYSVTELTGGEKKAAPVGAVEISPEGGEALYWGKGRCFTCHSLGDRGSAVRGPNHGQLGEKFPLPMGLRAVERAKERAAKTGKKFTALDYIVESMADPGAYVVKGYKNEMAVVYAPPISLSLDEIKAIAAYMLSQGGDFDPEFLNQPSEITQGFFGKIAVASAAGGGDPAHGKEVYEETCGDCHSLEGEPGDVGPDLSTVGKKGLKFISEAILLPAKSIAKGFETYVAVKKDGRKVVGLKTRDEDGEVDLVTKDGDEVTIKKSDINELAEDKTSSIMPDDLSEEMTVKDYQDVLSFMLMQKGKKK